MEVGTSIAATSGFMIRAALKFHCLFLLHAFQTYTIKMVISCTSKQQFPFFTLSEIKYFVELEVFGTVHLL
jgi:hypothetical protein